MSDRALSRRKTAGLLVALAISLVAGCGPDRPRFPRAPVVLISIDTLRADRLPAYGWTRVATPAIDRIARDGIVYENAYSHYPLTLPSHVSILTGLLPPEHGVRDNAGYRLDAGKFPSLPVRFREAGYATGAFVSAYVLRQETGLGVGFDRYEDAISIEPGASLDSGQRSGLETTRLARDWLREQKGRSFFLFLHLYEPHAPYTPPAPFDSVYSDPYDGEVAAADAAVGALLAELDALGLYDRSILAVLSDHGEGLGDHGEQQHGVFLYRSTMHVPLLLKLPGNRRKGEREKHPVGLQDVAPTLARLAGLEFEGGPQSRFLLERDPRALASRVIYAETYYPRIHYGWSDLQAAYESRFALIDAPEPELYDLDRDPGQTRNVLAEHRRDYARLLELVRSIDRPLSDPEKVDPETAARLAALGYLTVSSVRKDDELPDPKSQRYLLADIEEGFASFSRGELRESIARFRRVLAANDRMADVWAFVARAHHQLGEEAESVRAWERVLELSGGNADVALLVGAGQLRLGATGRARELAAIAARSNPAAAEELFAEIDLATGARGEALARLERLEREGSLRPATAQRLALFRLEQGRPAEAARLLEPHRARGETALLVLYGLALSELGRNDEALAALEQALQRGDRSAKLHEALGTVLLRLNDPARARGELERAVALEPQRADAWNTLGVALYRLGDPRSALRAWERALALRPDRLDVLFNYGLVAAATGQRQAARRALERFLSETHERSDWAGDRARARAVLEELRKG